MKIIEKIKSLQKSTKILLIIGIVLATANIVMYNSAQIDMSKVTVAEPSGQSLEELIELDKVYREKVRKYEEARKEAQEKALELDK